MIWIGRNGIGRRRIVRCKCNDGLRFEENRNIGRVKEVAFSAVVKRTK